MKKKRKKKVVKMEIKNQQNHQNRTKKVVK